jgi:hypothetical protein
MKYLKMYIGLNEDNRSDKVKAAAYIRVRNKETKRVLGGRLDAIFNTIYKRPQTFDNMKQSLIGLDIGLGFEIDDFIKNEVTSKWKIKLSIGGKPFGSYIGFETMGVTFLTVLYNKLMELSKIHKVMLKINK